MTGPVMIGLVKLRRDRMWLGNQVRVCCVQVRYGWVRSGEAIRRGMTWYDGVGCDVVR
jgi:hypothetical protein